MGVGFSLINKISQYIEILVEVGYYLEPRDIIHLYSVSRRFNETLNANITSSIRMWVRDRAEESSDIFSFRLYRKLCIPDPVGRTNAFSLSASNQSSHPQTQQSVRLVPTLRWYEMVVHREDCVDDIVEVLEAAGHRLPRGMELVLKKLWLLMDVATTEGRRNMLANRALWTPDDLHQAQMFFVKLAMFMLDPVWPNAGATTMPQLLLGQRGLEKTWRMLTRRELQTPDECERLKVKYDYVPSAEEFRRCLFGEDLYGVPPGEVGTVHLEAWGRGSGHLARPDELIPEEATRRGFEVDKHIVYMILWGRLERPAAEDIIVDFENPPLEDLDDEGPEPTWQELHYYEKADLMKEDLFLEGENREYLHRVQISLAEHRASSAEAQATGSLHPLVAAALDASQPPCSPASDAETDVNPHDGLDLTALPDPARVPSRVTALTALYAGAHLSASAAEPTMTPAIQAALAASHAETGRDPGVVEYIARKLFGPAGVPFDVELLDRADRAWVVHEVDDDDDEEWDAYVEWINAPGDSEFGDEDDLYEYD